MPITQPDFIPIPWAENGNKQDPIDPSTPPSVGRATWSDGFPPITAEQEENGGIPPNRLDFQGVLYALSAHLFFGQSGNLYQWNSGLDYNAGAHVLGSNGTEYIAVAASGVSTTPYNPTTDNGTHWKTLRMYMTDYVYPVGSVYMTTDNAFNPATTFGGTWSKIQNSFLYGSGTFNAGSTGGSATQTLTVSNMPSHNHGFSLTAASNGAHTHTANLTAASNGAHTHSISGTASSNGAHNHTASTASNGAHTHTRGSMEITGTVNFLGTKSYRTITSTSGAFINGGEKYEGSEGCIAHSSENQTSYLSFKASNSWTGSTSSAGAHTHTVTVNSAGAHTHTVSGTAASAGAHTHTVSGSTGAAGAHTHSVTGSISNTGGGAAFSTMPPYYVVNIWRRTA